MTISDKNNIVFNRAYGYANLEKKEKLTTEHIFRIASHSKTFTAAAIMQLSEKGQLQVDNAVIKYLPWLKKHNDARFATITIRQLLSHGSGIIRDGLELDYWQLEEPFLGEDRFIDAVLETPLVFDNDLRMKYSNFGYGLLGLVIEAISGSSYSQYVENEIIDVLGLENTGPDYSKNIENKLVTGYTRADLDKARLPITKNIDTKSYSPATGFYSTAEDICKFYSALFVDSNHFLATQSKQEMQKTHWSVGNVNSKREYGLGLDIVYPCDRYTFGHAGAFPGQRTRTICDSANNLIITVLVNCIDAEPTTMAKDIYSVIDYFKKNTSINKPGHNLNRYTGRFANLWSITDIVTLGDKIIAVFPNSWRPFDDVEELQCIDADTFKVIKASGLRSEGELVRFNFDNQGAVDSMQYWGTMWPIAEYLKKIAQTKEIGADLPHPNTELRTRAQ